MFEPDTFYAFAMPDIVTGVPGGFIAKVNTEASGIHPNFIEVYNLRNMYGGSGEHPLIQLNGAVYLNLNFVSAFHKAFIPSNDPGNA